MRVDIIGLIVPSPHGTLPSRVEATAPCRLELIGGALKDTSRPDLVLRIAVALDRRVFCRVEPIEKGVEIHSKDTGDRIVADDAQDITAGPFARVARMLVAARVRSGIRVVIQVRVPADAGLGSEGALQVALSGALGLGSAEIQEQELLTADVPGVGPVPSDVHAALFGGAHVLRSRGGIQRVERVAADPARLEECLSLVDPGPAPWGVLPAGPDPGAGLRAQEALKAGAYDDVSAILSEGHGGWFESATPAVRSLVAGIGHAGGAAWPSGRLIAVWAVPGAHAPGSREAVAALVKAAGLRSFAVRVDLRGLEVEQV